MIRYGGNADSLAKRYKRRAQALGGALVKGLRRAASAVNREQIKNLSGSNSAEPGSYPVPNRSGNLMRDANWAVDAGASPAGYVFNTAEYANAIHTGEMETPQGVKYAVRPRPFLDDAVNKVDVSAEMATAFRQDVMAIR
ncbi:MAG: hypothetical protein SV201_14905 [Pseudomonadota bacterium]|nr:hypothetical protein [Pseudomonadota bacterium]